MANYSYRRQKKWWEHLLLSTPSSLFLGILFCVVLPYGLQFLFRLSLGYSSVYWNHLLTNTLVLCSICYFMVFAIYNKLTKSYPGTGSVLVLLPQIVLVYLAGFVIFSLLRLPIAHIYILIAFLCCSLWMSFEHHIKLRSLTPKLAVLDIPETHELKVLDNLRLVYFSPYHLPNDIRFDAVVVDLNQLDSHGERFIANLIVKGIAVYDVNEVFEIFTGRARIHHIAQNNIGSSLPSNGYLLAKSIIDSLIVLLLSPVALTLILIFGLCIKLEDGGPVFYTQKRIGKGGRPFLVYKLRSMRVVKQVDPKADRHQENARILKVGKFIRKTRIDELPQFWNILKGDMNLIGPRPEMPELVRKYRREVPFYTYRHTVKPGISGWAQVRQGYTYDSHDTQIKLEHDCYYIKNCSLALDFYIFLLTILTVLTGFGAR